MAKVPAAIAVIAGWLTIPIGAVAGVVASKYFGLNVAPGELPQANVYGVNAAVIMVAYVIAALLTAAALQAWLSEPDPQPNLRLLASGTAVVGLMLLPNELGRAFGLPLLAGAAAFWIGGELVPREVAAPETGPGATAPDEVAGATETGASPEIPAGVAEAAETPASAAPVEAAGSPAAPPPARAGAARGRDQTRVCPWCSNEVPADAVECPSCRAALDTSPAAQTPIPGLTELTADHKRYAAQAGTKKKKVSLISMIFSDDSIPEIKAVPPPSDASALRPPTPELKAAMARLDAEIATAGAPEPDEQPASEDTPAGDERND